MSTLLMSAVRSVFAPVGALRDCPPGCRTETTCSGGVLLRRECCVRIDCAVTCSAWSPAGSC